MITPGSLASSKLVRAGADADAVAFAVVRRYEQGGKSLRVEEANESLRLLQLIYREEAIKGVASPVERILEGYVLAVCEAVERTYRSVYGQRSMSKAPEGHHLPPEVTRALWENGLELNDRGPRLENILHLQSMHNEVSERAFRAAAQIMQTEVRPSIISEVAARSSSHTPLLAGIWETTKSAVRTAVEAAIKAGKNFRDTLALVRQKAQQIAKGRSGVISRTEAVRATNVGVATAARRSPVVSHISVVGCMFVEWKGPHFYRGLPTCNIQNVPASDVDSLEFHPNHTGFFAVSGITDSNGLSPSLQLTAGS
jgi:hypothetical protein